MSIDHMTSNIHIEKRDMKQKWVNANEETLLKQSRSFAIPILHLDERFRLPIMIEYNLNKTIDTIEDSTELGVDEKISLINLFCKHLNRCDFSPEVYQRMIEITPLQEAYVFKNYQSTIELFKILSNAEKVEMKKWTTKMAEGMCIFLERTIYNLKDLNEYCYYVAGTVGIYLTNILRLKGMNITDPVFKRLEENAVPFGLFLQKLNIIRDYTEDRDLKKRTFWPRDYFTNEKDNIKILDKMCAETLENDVPGAIEYYKDIPPGNESYDYFIRFILSSGLEYLKILQGNKSIFSKIKVKLPSVFIKELFGKVSSQTRDEFQEYCEKMII
jgi:farnesyl-diphosphate farnesyltransferase